MPTLAAAKASNATYSPSYVPTAVFIGGTSGIGRAMAEFYAKQTNGRANIILIGRDKVVGESVIASFPSPATTDPTTGSAINVKYEFIQCDASLMKNVETATKELLSKLSKINILVLSFAKLTFSRSDTAEGNDISLVTRYLARAKFVEELMPLLEKAKEMGEDARVESILGSPRAAPVDLNDLDARNVNAVKLGSYTGTYNDVMIKTESELHPSITFVHIYPGGVDTPGLRINWFFSFLASTILSFFLLTPEDSAQYMLYPLLSSGSGSGSGTEGAEGTDVFSKGGWYRMGKNADELPARNDLTEELVKKVWDWTLERIKVQA